LKGKVTEDDAEMEMGILARMRGTINTVYFYGFCENPLRIVTEFVPAGCLYDNLEQLRLRKESLSPVQQIGIILDCAIGMKSIHSLGVLHQDGHSGNVFLTKDRLHAKIGDFGLSRLAITKDLATNHIHIRAPEIWAQASGDATSKAADVYSFHVIMWEVLTGQAPYQGLSNAQVAEFVVGGGRMPFSSPSSTTTNWNSRLESIMRSCGHQDPTERPSFDDLVEQLSSVAEQLMGHDTFLVWKQFSDKQDRIRRFYPIDSEML